MFVIRPVKKSDLKDLVKLAKGAGAGLTTLPADEKLLAARIEISINSFANEGGDEPRYFFVAEDVKKKKIIGTSAILANVGKVLPFYNYKLLKLMQVTKEPYIKVETQVLSLSNDYTGACELATLYLDPEYRSAGVGKVLSKCRYLFMAAYPQHFNSIIMAEIRGWVDDDGESPFWNAVGRHFFNMDFDEADRINGLGNNQFIGDLMPKYPIYTNLLPEGARAVIGKPHVKSAAALKLLEQEGFKYRGAVDIFDAGPIVEAHIDHIKSVRDATQAMVHISKDEIVGGACLVANPSPTEFAVINAPVEFHDGKKNKIIISQDSAEALNVVAGMEVIYLPPEHMHNG